MSQSLRDILITKTKASLADELAALREQRCETCQKWDECGEDGQGECEYFGVHLRADFGCKAWARREP